MVLPPAFLMRGAYLGIRLLELTPELRTHFGVATDAGVLVSRVEKGSPAEKAGLKAGDIVTSIDGEKVASGWDIGRVVRPKKSGEQIRIDYVRDGARKQALAAVTERERSRVDVGRVLIDEDGPNGQRIVVDGVGDAMVKLEKYFDSPEWKAKVESMQDCSRVQVRVKDLEKRLQELEKKLNEK
jgi:C-terminal processing protease CtpA/Prc